MGTLVVDAENVRRSVWPNVSQTELVRLCGWYAHEHGLSVAVVFDGAPPTTEARDDVRLVGEPGRSADDLIVELVATFGPEAATVATSDRGIRQRLGGTGASLVGGGSFIRELLRL